MIATRLLFIRLRTIFVAGLISLSLGAALTNSTLAADDINIQSEGQGEVLFELIQEINILRQEIQELRATVEQQQQELRTIDQGRNDLYADTDARLRRLESAKGQLTAPDRPASLGTAAPTPGGKDTNRRSHSTQSSEEDRYNAAFNHLKRDDYEGAIEAFNAFLQDFDESDKYYDNALYWLGESYYVLRTFDSAITEFQKLVEDYPDSPKRGDAMLKIGYAKYELGQYEDARSVLTTVRDEFPDSSIARLAIKRLKRIPEGVHPN